MLRRTKLFHVIAFAALFLAICVQTIQAAPISGQGTWQTTLQNRDLNGDGTVDAFYDIALNITWLSNANAVGNDTTDTDGYANGRMNWDAATAWAANLNVYGVTGWRLPTVNDTGTPGCNLDNSGTDCGSNVQTSTGNIVNSELAHLYYVTLGNLAYYDAAGTVQPGFGLANTANFTNFEQYRYWSGTQYLPDSNYAWLFSTSAFFSPGAQSSGNKIVESYAVAVRSGDVGATGVPLAPTVLLLLPLLAFLAFRKRTR
jgi:hypothetical protein